MKKHRGTVLINCYASSDPFDDRYVIKEYTGEIVGDFAIVKPLDFDSNTLPGWNVTQVASGWRITTVPTKALAYALIERLGRWRVDWADPATFADKERAKRYKPKLHALKRELGIC